MSGQQPDGETGRGPGIAAIEDGFGATEAATAHNQNLPPGTKGRDLNPKGSQDGRGGAGIEGSQGTPEAGAAGGQPGEQEEPVCQALVARNRNVSPHDH